MCKQNKKIKKIASSLIALALLFVLAPGVLEASACAKAFFNCLDDPIVSMNYFGPLYCGTGYLFCIKYVGD